VKERVVVPWIPRLNTNTLPTSASVATGDTPSLSGPTSDPIVPVFSYDSGSGLSTAELRGESHARILSSRHFEKALKEITPSSSEALGSLADLRKWNEEFGEGRKDKKRRQVWGKDRFGFTDKSEQVREEGRVVSIGPPSSESDSTGVKK